MPTRATYSTMGIKDRRKGLLCRRDDDWNFIIGMFVYVMPENVSWGIVHEN
jgi:hypothetical protein